MAPFQRRDMRGMRKRMMQRSELADLGPTSRRLTEEIVLSRHSLRSLTVSPRALRSNHSHKSFLNGWRRDHFCLVPTSSK